MTAVPEAQVRGVSRRALLGAAGGAAAGALAFAPGADAATRRYPRVR